MENRSFDHYLGSLQLVEGNTNVEGLDGTETNPDQNGDDVAVYEMDNFTPVDPPHGWSACHNQWDNGSNDGFVQAHFASNGDAVKQEVMGYHVRQHLPVHYALADAYTVCDHWFASLLGPTWPNRYYLHCATSNGRTDNTPAAPLPRTIQDACGDAGITHRNYFDGIAAWRWGAFPITGFAGTTGIGEFFDKLQNGSGLEQVVILDPDFLSNDDHPDHDITLGQAFIASVYEALAQSDYWESSLLIITYDEHGGFFDHVSPPTTVDDQGAEFQQMGFRVPTLVIGPHVRKGEVVSTTFEHSSFAKTVALRFGFPQLNDRADAAADLSSCIDPAFVDDPQPPVSLPQMALNDDEILEQAGRITSQPELFEAAGIEVPLRGEHLAQERRSLQALIDRGRKLGVVRPRGG
jgi:phospholipase C